jgi:hypothetical protein
MLGGEAVPMRPEPLDTVRGPDEGHLLVAEDASNTPGVLVDASRVTDLGMMTVHFCSDSGGDLPAVFP